MNGGLREYTMDLHVHTALSPCADDSCTPPEIVFSALRRGMNVIAITDHNSAENTEAVARAAGNEELKVIPGMELTTIEEAHLVCLFRDCAAALSFQDAVYKLLPKEENRPEIFGNQHVMDETGKIIGECPKLLSAAAALSVEKAARMAHEEGGLVFAAHIDRPSFSVISNLGWAPPDAGLDAVEISAATTKSAALASIKGISGFPMVTASDAHHPDLIGTAFTLFLLEEATIEEIALALAGLGGREFLIQ